MRTFQGRKNQHGYWVAAGQHRELLAAVALEEDVRIELPKRSVITKLVRVGQAFPWVDDEPPWAYGYPAKPIPNMPSRPLRRRLSRLVRPAVVAPAPEPPPPPVAAPETAPEDAATLF